MYSILIIQENGRHERNREFRECFSLQRAFSYLGITADVWGLGHDNFQKPFDVIIRDYDAIISLENYDSGWHPDLSSLKIPKVFWCIDAHMGVERYQKFVSKNKFDVVFNSTEYFVDHFLNITGQSLWLPNAYDSFLIDKRSDVPKTVPLGFCGNIANRVEWITYLKKRWNLKLDEMVIGPDMVQAINSYQIHWNRNFSIDINYRTFETLGCGTFLLTNYTPGLEKLFKINQHLVIYESRDDLDEKISYYLSHQEERDLIAQQGYEHVRNNHTYVHRALKIKKVLGIDKAATVKATINIQNLVHNSTHSVSQSQEISYTSNNSILEISKNLVRVGEWLGYYAGLNREKNFQVDLKDFGGSSVEKPLFDWIVSNLSPGSTILELGSGQGSTKNLSRFYRLYSVEDKLEFIGLYDSTYIYAPIINNWYAVDILRSELPDHYDLILVDGPTGEGNRWGFLHHLDLFNTNVPIVFDDIWRQAERDMMFAVAEKLGKKPILFEEWNFFGIVM